MSSSHPEPFEIQSTDTENENESEYGGSVADDTNAETANNDAAGTEDNVDADSSNTLPAASNFGELGCAFNCSGHGVCVKRESTSTSNSTDAGDGGGDESGVQCECLAYWAGSGCSLPTAYNTEEIQNDKNFTISLLIGVGLIGGVLLLERLVASCRKVYLKRQGRDGKGLYVCVYMWKHIYIYRL